MESWQVDEAFCFASILQDGVDSILATYQASNVLFSTAVISMQSFILSSHLEVSTPHP